MTTVELSANQARELTDRIKTGMEVMWELIKEAYQSRAWSALGYSSWDDYCGREFGSSRIKLPREERQEVVSSMREIGMSTRAIASATGVSRPTIIKDSRESSGGKELTTPDPQPVTGTDGKTYSAQPPRKPETPPVDIEETPRSDGPRNLPEWEDVGTIPKSRLNDVAPPRPEPRPAPGFNDGDLDELNNGHGRPDTAPVPQPPAEKNDVVVPDEYFDRKDHFVQMLQQARKAEKALKELLFLAQHVDTWDRGSLTDGFRGLLDEIDQTLNSGGMDAALSRLIEGEK